MSEKQAEVLVSIYLDGTLLKVEIQDNGCGMTLDQVERALEGQSFKAGGNGIGLSQAQRQLKSWRAKLQIDSIVDSGTTVTMEFPVLKKQFN